MTAPQIPPNLSLPKYIILAFAVGGVFGYLIRPHGSSSPTTTSVSPANEVRKLAGDGGGRRQTRTVPATAAGSDAIADNIIRNDSSNQLGELIGAPRKMHLEKLRAEYTALFYNFGLDSKSVAPLLEKIMEINSGAVVAGDSLTKLMLDRLEYDREVKKVLGADGYRRYREYESDKQYNRDAKSVADFASSIGTQLDANELQALAKVLKHGKNTWQETWDLPYDDIPKPSVGREMVTQTLTANIENLQRALATLKESPAGSVAPETADTFEKYVTQMIAHAKSNILDAQRTPGQRISDAMEEVKSDIESRTGIRPPSP